MRKPTQFRLNHNPFPGVTVSPDENSQPIWARHSSFPPAPDSWGWMDLKGRRHMVASQEQLVEAVRTDKSASVALVWTPQHAFMILPEELDEASDAVLAARKTRAQDDWEEGRKRCGWIGLLLLGYTLYLMGAVWTNTPPSESWMARLMDGIRVIIRSMPLGVGLLVFLIAGFIPWYQGRKRSRELERHGGDTTAAIIPLLRFETWLDLQKAPMTRWLMGGVALVGLFQLLPGDSIHAAGLVKPAYAHGEWWRLFTYSMLHGNLIHFLMNGAALLYLGKRIELFARWPHLLLVFVFASAVGGELSARLMEATTVGASGGLMGWLGFLLVFETLHQKLVPASARRRLLAGVVLTAVIGLIGYRFIDNAVHAGGLLAGMVYAAVVFIKSSSIERPRVMGIDWIAGCLAAMVIVASIVMAVRLILIS